jgi:hypothetical protein
MIYVFRSSGNDGDANDDFISVDTDSEETKRRVAWVAKMAGVSLPTVHDYLNMSPNASGGNVAPGVSVTLWGQYAFEKDGVTVPVDVRIFADGGGLVKRLQGAISGLSILLGLGLSPESIAGMIYEEPAPTEPAEDWQAPGSPMAEPLPGQPGRYKSKGTGRQIGDVWTGPSGAVYELQNIGGIFQYLAWVRNA